MKNIDLNKSPLLPESGESRDSASGGAMGGVSKADLSNGFSKVKPGDSDGDDHGFFSDSDKGGFLNRPQGWER